MLATDLSDILCGTPKPLTTEANLGMLKADEVNIIIHGHEPMLSELHRGRGPGPGDARVRQEQGRQGHQPGRHLLHRQRSLDAPRRVRRPATSSTRSWPSSPARSSSWWSTSSACSRAWARWPDEFHTDLVTTNPKGKISRARKVHIEFHEEHALETAKADRQDGDRQLPEPEAGRRPHPQFKSPVVAGFSHEYIRYMLGGTFRESLVPLNDNIINGKIQGVAAIVGCNNPQTTQDEGIVGLVQSFIENDVLVVVTGCAAHASGKHGYLTPEMFEKAGPGLSEVCETTGMPPVLHMGSCVDNTRILTAWPTSSRPAVWATTSTRCRPSASRRSTTARRPSRSPRTVSVRARTSSSAGWTLPSGHPRW